MNPRLSHITFILCLIASLWAGGTYAQGIADSTRPVADTLPYRNSVVPAYNPDHHDTTIAHIDSSRARHSRSVLDTVVVSPPRVAVASDTSTGRRRRSTLNDTWYYGHEPEKHFLIDSSIFQMHRFDVVRRDGPEYFNLGNMGTEAYPLVFSPSPSVGFNMGFHQFDAYRYSKDSIHYYQVIRPYAEIFYSLGINKDQLFKGRFANSHKNGLMYGVEFRRINSPGQYTRQRAIDNGFSLYGIYNSKDHQWGLESDLVYNSYLVQENGGLARDIIFKDSALFQKSLAPVNLQYAGLQYREISWYLKGTYAIGKKYNERINDTTVLRVVLPVFKVSYQFNLDYNHYQYFDLKGDSAYYPYLTMGDTMRYTSGYLKAANRFGLDYTAKKLTSDSTYKELNFIIGASANLDYFVMREFGQKPKFTNLYVDGYIKSNPAVNSRLLYKASVTYYMAGYNQNDLTANGEVGVDFRQFGRITAGAGYQLRHADWIYHSLRSDTITGIHTTQSNGLPLNANLDKLNYQYFYNLPRMSIFRFGGDYTVDKIGIRVSAYNYVLKNYFYFSGPVTPAYESRAMNMLVLSFSNRFGIKGFHFDNDVWFQKSAGSDVIRLPLVTTKTSVYYERYVFKKALLFAIGVDLRYYTPFKGNAYNPLTGQFYLQNDWELKFYPVMDVFLNVKIKTVRIYLMGTNLSSFFGKQKGYYTSPLYPAADATFKFGGAWRFFE